MKLIIFETKVKKHIFDTSDWGEKYQDLSKDKLIEQLNDASINIGFDSLKKHETKTEDWFFTIDTPDGEPFYEDT